MIHTRTGDVAPFGPDESNPFYLFCGGVPLPVAVKAGVPEAVAFRDGWESTASVDDRKAHLFDPLTRCWVGGAEDGADAVYRARTQQEMRQ